MVAKQSPNLCRLSLRHHRYTLHAKPTKCNPMTPPLAGGHLDKDFLQRDRRTDRTHDTRLLVTLHCIFAVSKILYTTSATSSDPIYNCQRSYTPCTPAMPTFLSSPSTSYITVYSPSTILCHLTLGWLDNRVYTLLSVDTFNTHHLSPFSQISVASRTYSSGQSQSQTTTWVAS